MTDHKAPPIAGYQDISEVKLRVVNDLKESEEFVLRKLDMLATAPFELDQRWLALARTHIQQGYMAAVRAVMQPRRIKLPGDGDA
jgi:hypothetical protein